MPEKSKEIIGYNLEQLGEVTNEIIAFAEDYKIWIFTGEMGMGKTTLIKSLCEAFEVEDLVSSPTYSIVNEYRNKDGKTFYHFDFYRIKDESEAMDIGTEEYFFSGAHCFIEWPEKIVSLVPERHLKIAIDLAEKNTRSIFLSKHDQ